VKLGGEFFVALRYLLGRAREGGRYLQGAAAGIAVSLIPIIVTLIVADGMIRGITDRYLELGTGHLQIYSAPKGREPHELAEDIEGIPGVRGVWAERHGMGVIMGTGGKAGADIRATDPSFWEDPGSARFLTTIEGSAVLESNQEALLGEALALSIGAEVGKPIYIMSIHPQADGRTIPLTLPFTVRGIVSSGYRELDSLWCIVSYEGGERLLSPEFSSTYLIVKVDDPYAGAERFSPLLRRALGYGYSVYTWKELQYSQYSSYESTRQLLLFIMALIVIVAAVNVSSATSMLVMERQRDIAVLKAAGTSPGSMGRIFLFSSFLTGLTGAVIGIALGLLIGNSINFLIHGLEEFLGIFSALFHGEKLRILDPGYYLEEIPIIINWKTVGLIGLLTVLCSVLASWLPARRAGGLKPLELLRKV
jgi:lipoprotein-releasing system permease protein